MTRTRDTEAATALGRKLTELWEAAGRPSHRAIERAIIFDVGVSAPSDETIRRMHNGDVDPNTCVIESIVGLARYYHVSPDDLGEAAGERVRHLLALSDQNWKISFPSEFSSPLAA
jgi:hypothetical protein